MLGILKKIVPLYHPTLIAVSYNEKRAACYAALRRKNNETMLKIRTEVVLLLCV
jgi:hypothetical protein